MNEKENKEEKRCEQIRKMDEKIEELRYERRQVENINEEDEYIFRYQDNNYEDMYNSTKDEKMRALIEEIGMSKKKRRRDVDDSMRELMNKFDTQERNIEEERERLHREDKKDEKNSNKSTKENEKENRWY